MKKWILGSFTVFLFTFFTSTWAASNAEFSDVEKLLNNWFTAMKDGDLDKAGSFLSPQFLSLHTDLITRNKDEEIALIKNLNMKSFKLSDFKFSKSGDVLVVTFINTGSEMIDGKPTSSKPAGRIAVLQKEGDKWLIIAYANLDKIKHKEKKND